MSVTMFLLHPVLLLLCLAVRCNSEEVENLKISSSLEKLVLLVSSPLPHTTENTFTQHHITEFTEHLHIHSYAATSLTWWHKICPATQVEWAVTTPHKVEQTQHNAAKYSTTQHSKIQHSTTQHKVETPLLRWWWLFFQGGDPHHLNYTTKHNKETQES